MSSPLFVPYIALLVLDETGMTLRCANPIPDISNEEIIGIGNFYSPVVSASSPHLEIYGPLPIPHHEKYHLLIVTFRKYDSLVQDPRTKDKKKLPEPNNNKHQTNKIYTKNIMKKLIIIQKIKYI